MAIHVAKQVHGIVIDNFDTETLEPFTVTRKDGLHPTRMEWRQQVGKKSRHAPKRRPIVFSALRGAAHRLISKPNPRGNRRNRQSWSVTGATTSTHEIGDVHEMQHCDPQNTDVLNRRHTPRTASPSNRKHGVPDATVCVPPNQRPNGRGARAAEGSSEFDDDRCRVKRTGITLRTKGHEESCSNSVTPFQCMSACALLNCLRLREDRREYAVVPAAIPPASLGVPCDALWRT